MAEAEGWAVSHTIDVLVRKAGYDGCVTPALRNSLQITRYQVRHPIWVCPMAADHQQVLHRYYVLLMHTRRDVSMAQSTTHSLTYEEFAAAAALASVVTTETAEQLQPGSPLVGAVPA